VFVVLLVRPALCHVQEIKSKDADLPLPEFYEPGFALLAVYAAATEEYRSRRYFNGGKLNISGM
jgi:hypothetical protein